MIKIAGLLMLITIVSKLFGFARNIVLAYFYGASNVSDAYLIALTIPSVIFAFIVAGISTGYIPMYSKIEKKYGVAEGNKYTNNLVNILLILCTLIAMLSLLFTEQIVKVFASGFEGETLELAIRFTQVSIIGIYFTGLIHIFSSYLQIKSNYMIPALIGFPFNFFIILSIFLSSNIHIMFLAVGSVIATASQLLLLLPFLRSKGYRYTLTFDFNDKHIKRMMYLSLPVIIGASVGQINVLVDRTIASRIVEGGISALNFANTLIGFVLGIFVVSISTAMYPLISKMATEKNIKGLKKSIAEAISGVNLLVIPATIGFMIFAQPIVTLLFGRGAFGEEAIALTSYALFFYSLGMIGIGLNLVLSRAFYSLQDMKTPMINATIAVVLNIILNIILSKFMGIGGLALATSISAIFTMILLFNSLRKKIGPFGLKKLTLSFMKISISSCLMGAIAWGSYSFLKENININVALFIAVVLGATVYFVLIYFMKIEEVDEIVSVLKRKLH
jgi:putative peptidoglycan lipid II flippase